MSNLYKYVDNSVRYFNKNTGEEVIRCRVCSNEVYKHCTTEKVCCRCIDHAKFINAILNK